MDVPCPLCSVADGREILSANTHAVAIWDAFPVSPGHALIVSRRHVADLFELTAEEQAAVWALLPAVKAAIDARQLPAGYNVGVNVGAAAGQTVGARSRARDSALRGRRRRPPWRRPMGATRPRCLLEAEPMTHDQDALALAERVLAILEEGSFSSTYKYALFTAILDLCIEHTDRHGTPRDDAHDPTSWQSEVRGLYWNHADPYGSHGTLRQGGVRPDSQAEILRRIETDPCPLG